MLRNKKVVIIVLTVLVVSVMVVAFLSLFSFGFEKGYGNPDELLAKSQIGEDVYFSPKYPYYSCTTNSSSPIQCTWISIDDPNTKVLIQFPNTIRPVPKISSASYISARILSKQGKTVVVLVRSVSDNPS